jgi:hypothetical protein
MKDFRSWPRSPMPIAERCGAAVTHPGDFRSKHLSHDVIHGVIEAALPRSRYQEFMRNSRKAKL